MFRSLSDTEEKEFRQWARENFDPKKEVSRVWHPVIRDEWATILTELDESPNVDLGE